jgi:hypothetical protein
MKRIFKKKDRYFFIVFAGNHVDNMFDGTLLSHRFDGSFPNQSLIEKEITDFHRKKIFNYKLH